VTFPTEAPIPAGGIGGVESGPGLRYRDHEGKIKMGAQSEFSENTLPAKRRLVEVLAINPANLRNDRPQSQWRGLGKRGSLALGPLLITFCIGVAATVAWLSHGDAAREAIASSFSRLGWLTWRAAAIGPRTPDVIVTAAASPDRQLLNEMSLNLDALWQRVDQLRAGQEQMAHNIKQITAAQEQLTLEVTKQHAIEQYILAKNPELPRATQVPRHSTLLRRQTDQIESR
jgi:methyl-accepting chemotaxis protein